MQELRRSFSSTFIPYPRVLALFQAPKTHSKPRLGSGWRVWRDGRSGLVGWSPYLAMRITLTITTRAWKACVMLLLDFA